MTLFDADSVDDHAPRRRPLRERVGWIALTAAVAIGIVFALLPSPYVIEEPGPVYDTLGTQTQKDGTRQPLITIPDAKTYPTTGELNLLTVSVIGQPNRTPGWLEVLGAWIDRTRSVVPVEAIFPPGLTDQQRSQQNTTLMVDSQQDAIAAALVELGYDFPRDVTVRQVIDGSPAAGVLKADDVIASVNGAAVHSIDELRAAVRANGSAKPAQLGVTRGGQHVDLALTPADQQGVAVLGVGVQMHYDFPIKVDIKLDDVGGPSAGMMFALGIVDKLTPGSMTGGKNFAGTGTIDASGVVGPIGGIREKLWGAKAAGASWFLAPAADCGDVVGHVPDGMKVFSVKTLDQARKIVEAVGASRDTSGFPGCTAGS